MMRTMKTSIFEEINLALESNLVPHEIISLGILEEYCKSRGIGINEIELKIEEAMFYGKPINDAWLDYERYSKDTSDWFVFKYGNFFDWYLILTTRKKILTEENIIRYHRYLNENNIIFLIEQHIIDLECLKKLLDLKKDFIWSYVRFGIRHSRDWGLGEIREFLENDKRIV